MHQGDQTNNDLSISVKTSLDQYFKDLEGEPPHAVYNMLLACVEKPMLEYIMQYAAGNQSKAAEILGLNRNTLRKKIQQYNLD
jgi:Fis family transcriptional regulator